MELHKRRKAITEPETRYFVRQVILACQYLHSNKIIHRDLKLGNLFINDEMEIKIGDFGLATRLDYDGERKRYFKFFYQNNVKNRSSFVFFSPLFQVPTKCTCMLNVLKMMFLNC